MVDVKMSYKLLTFQIFFSLITSHLPLLPKEKQPYLQVFLKFSIIQIRPMNLFMVECSTRCQNISERAKDTLEIYAVINHM